MTSSLDRALLLGSMLVALLCLSTCELESGDCTDASDINVQFKITATLMDAAGKPAAGAPGYIRTFKDVCDGTQKSVAPVRTKASAAGQLIAIHGYNLRSKEDRVGIEVGFDDSRAFTPTTKTFTYDQLKASNGQTLVQTLEVRAGD